MAGAMARRVLEGVVAPHGMNSVLTCLAGALQYAGEAVGYSYLMGVSGRAFRLQYSWCPSCPHAVVGYNVYDAALSVTGYAAHSYPLASWEAETRHQRGATDQELASANAAMRASINAGVPVLMGSEECDLLVGYEPVGTENPTGWLMRPRAWGARPSQEVLYAMPVDKLPWCIDTLERVGEPVARRQAVLDSLRRAVWLAREATLGETSIGFAAWERWISELRDVEPVFAKSQGYLDQFDTQESAPFEIQLGNAWCYDSLIDARRCAAEYLREQTGLFAADVARALENAAAAYDHLVETLSPESGRTTCIAPYPWMENEPWTQALRDEQSGRLSRAYEREQVAVAAIERALAQAI